MILDGALVARIAQLVGQVAALDVAAGEEDSAGDLRRLHEAAALLSTETARLRADPEATARQARHDLRNPLGALIGYAELLAEEMADVRLDSVRSSAAELLDRLEAL